MKYKFEELFEQIEELDEAQKGVNIMDDKLKKLFEKMEGLEEETVLQRRISKLGFKRFFDDPDTDSLMRRVSILEERLKSNSGDLDFFKGDKKQTDFLLKEKSKWIVELKELRDGMKKIISKADSLMKKFK